ncbi:MAG: PQQ-binding-like beta-propeller repeat protein [bacterium]|nr:PQQ-binding-like beta-propeller repeat protein [bacterium]
MKARWFVLLALPLLWGVTASAQDNPDSPWGLKNADLFATNLHSVNWLFSSGGVVGTPVSLGSQVNRPGGHYEVQIMFDSQGNLYVRGSTAPNAEPNNSVRIYSLTPEGVLRWRSDNLFGNFTGPGPLVGQNAVYALGSEYGKTGAGSTPVVAALDKNTGATLWTRTLPEGEPGYAATLFNGVLYVATRDYLRSTGEEDIPTVTIYAINAANGNILRRYDVTVSRTGWTATPRTSLTIVPNAFGAGAHGLYFTVDRAPARPADPTVFGINLATGDYWATSAGKANHSHIIYSPVTNELIKVSWSDYGQTIATFDPRTGAIKHQSNWNPVSIIDPLRSLEDPNSVLSNNIGGHGYCDTAALLPDGTSVITAGFNGTVALYTRDATGAYTGRILMQGASYWGEYHNMAQLVVPPDGLQPIWITATRSERSETGQTVMVVAVGALTGEVLWQYDTGRGSHVDLRGGAVIGPSGYVYYMTPDNVLHILKPAPAPQIDGVVEMPGYVGPVNTGSGDGTYTAAIPLTLEFRQPGTQTVQFRKTVALSVSNGVATFKLNNIRAGTYDIAAKGYINYVLWNNVARTFRFSRTIRALVPNVTVPANGTGSVTVNLTLFAGDADGDNEVSLLDFGLLLPAFGTARGGSGWSQTLDFDGDEEVSLLDFGVLLQNFGLVGEE